VAVPNLRNVGRLISTSIVGVTIMAGPLFAQAPSQADAARQPADREPAVAGDDDRSRVDVLDLVRRAMGRPTPPADASAPRVVFALVPIIGAQPHVGFKAGVGATIAFGLGPATDTQWSSVTTSATFSTRRQLGASLNPVVYGPHNGWRFEGRNAFTEKNTDNVALGTSSPAGVAPNIDYHSTQFVDTFYLRAWGQFYIGAGINYVRQGEIAPASGVAGEWQTSPFHVYSVAHGYEPAWQASAGATLALLYDDRDNPNDAIHGWRLEAVLRRTVQGFLGGDSAWQDLFGEARTYHALTEDRRHKLAFWTFGDFVTSGAPPYLSLPTSGGDLNERSARGYAYGRFRGEQMLYAELEYRGLVTRNGFLGVVSFVNVSTLTNHETGERLFDSGAVGGGGGLRVLLSKQSRANVCVDAGVGRRSHGIYVGLNDAF
jgi:hypothetical protein